MNTFKQAALAILSRAAKPLHYREITRLALDQGLLETEGATPEATMNAQLSVEIKTKGALADFVRTAPSIYDINPQRHIQEKQSDIAKCLEKKSEETIESSYIGRAGEYLVCSELLFRGFNASMMSIDTGIDIVATKDDHLFGIQVKTARLNRFNTYVFDVRKVSFERHNASNIYYIFVLYSETQTNYLIVPCFEMERKVKERAILEVGHGARYRINIKFREDKVYLGTVDHEMGYFLNNWETIK